APGSYNRGTRWVIVVFPAPDGPTSAVSFPAGATKLTSRKTHSLSVLSRMGSAIDSSEASDISLAAGYRKQTLSNSTGGANPLPFPETGRGIAPDASAISGLRSSTSNTRSKLTSAVRKLTCTLVSALIGP